VVHARTLEFYRQIGIADDVVRNGREFVAANLWAKGRQVGHVEFGALGQGLSPFPYMVIFPQDEHERLLIGRLEQLGVHVERPVELMEFHEEGDRVVGRLKRTDGSEETIAANYIAGCDGAHSTVRNVLKIGFPGGTYEHMFYVADTAASGPVINGELHVALDETDFLAVFPLKQDGHARFIGTVKEETLTDSRQLAWDDVSNTAMQRLGVHVDRVNWFSTYHVHHRVAECFRVGRAFLLGDAAHVHSPVGGQGMNTGIGDAVNLSWKVAAVLRNQSEPQILETYEPERIAFARRLVATTDRAFTFVTSSGRIARFIRTRVAPLLLPPLFRSKAMRRFMFRTVSQIGINYRHSKLSEGSVRDLEAGDRLPWVPFENVAGAAQDNFVPLQSLSWQLHVYGEVAREIATVCQTWQIELHTFPWQNTAREAVLTKNAIYLVRPDGYIGFADREANAAKLARYLRSQLADRANN
jgi:2-polyprenyl-6-methoxyphenol hydroxylase-like FAD-dependent oxidoreductase